jgi:hypothetical protein
MAGDSPRLAFCNSPGLGLGSLVCRRCSGVALGCVLCVSFNVVVFFSDQLHSGLVSRIRFDFRLDFRLDFLLQLPAWTCFNFLPGPASTFCLEFLLRLPASATHFDNLFQQLPETTFSAYYFGLLLRPTSSNLLRELDDSFSRCRSLSFLPRSAVPCTCVLHKFRKRLARTLAHCFS